MSKECKKKEKGITLTGLVITIIVLIILAGISLSYIISEGIIDKAQEAGQKMNQAAGEEEEGLKNLSNEIDTLINGVVIPEGAISIGEVEWEEGKASVQVSTDTEYEIEWQKEGEESWSKVENGGKIEGLEHGDIIFIRLTDGTHVGEESTVRVEDKTAPNIQITGGSSSNSITVQVEATDNETGMEENPTYTYYYKESTEPDSSYRQVNQETSNTCTINGLTQGTKYTVKVEVADNAGNVGSGTVDITTETVTSGTVEGAIEFSPATWSSGTASITISTNTSYTIEWQIGDAEEENWTTGTNVTGLHHGDIVFARLTDGINVGQEATTKIEDKTAPTVTVTETGKTSNSISVQVQATDNETGMASSPTYTYYYKVSGQPDTSYKQANQGTSTTCTINGLTQGTTYTVKVEVADNAGNVGSGTVDITTATVTSGTVEGAIEFSPATWSNGTASITISTNTSYTIEWQIGDAEEGNWTTGTSVTGLHHGDIVFARLTDGINAGQEASAKIEDKTAPTVTVSETGKTSNSISVQVQATDNETGMASSPTYTYYYKVSGQPDTSYKQANQGTSTTCTINGLTQGTKYTVKVEVADNAENVGSGTVDITTATVTSGLVEGAIQFSPATWSNGTASVTISTNTSYTIEWQIGDAEEGKWTTGTSVTGLHHGDIVFARLTDGINAGQEASAKIEDKIDPTISAFTVTATTANSITVQVTASDAQTGIATYAYKKNSESYVTGTGKTYTFSGLASGTSYTLGVKVTDAAGNDKEATVTGTTKQDENIIANKLKQGSYVNFVDGKGYTRKCVVLYGPENSNYGSYGIQIITMNSLETFEINGRQGEYNNAIRLLNQAAGAYLNSSYASVARSVGSVPNNPNQDSSGYRDLNDGPLKDTDNNYEADWNQMNSLRIYDIGEEYWLASRKVTLYVNPEFAVRYVDENGKLDVLEINRLSSGTGRTLSYSKESGLRVVFTLRPNVRVTGGNGTSSSPYTLGL